jgi:hypothetical protein
MGHCGLRGTRGFPRRSRHISAGLIALAAARTALALPIYQSTTMGPTAGGGPEWRRRSTWARGSR